VKVLTTGLELLVINVRKKILEISNHWLLQL